MDDDYMPSDRELSVSDTLPNMILMAVFTSLLTALFMKMLDKYVRF